MKICTRCNVPKEESEYHKQAVAKDGLNTYCKDCRNALRRSSYINNPEYNEAYKKTESYRIAQEKRNAKLRERNRLKKERYYNSPEFELKQKLRKEKRKQYHNEYVKNKYRTNIHFKLARSLRQRLWAALHGKIKTGSAVSDMGCSLPELKTHIQSKFKDGMNWDNHGEWEIDHVKPLSIFNLTDRKQFLEACHFSNLQPLWKMENLLKSNKLV